MKKMKLKLDYGRTGLDVELPTERLVGPLAIRDVPPLPDPEAAVAIGSARSDRHARPARDRPGAERRLHLDLRYHAAGSQPDDLEADARGSCIRRAFRASGR